MIQDVGFHGLVLDAGCGLGQFSEMIATTTSMPVACVDLDVATNHANRTERLHLAGDVQALPLRSGAVDGVWCSNTLMYTSDPQLVLSEYMRVCKPSGIIAIKEEDSSRDLILSWNPELEAAVRQAWEAALTGGEVSGDGYMGRRVPFMAHTVGLEHLRVRSYLIERVQPFTEHFQQYVTQAFMFYGDVYRRHLPPQRFREMLVALDPANSNNFFRTAGSHVICIETVVSGRTPPEPTSGR